MARKSLIQRQIKRQIFQKKFKNKRLFLKNKIKIAQTLDKKLYWHFKLQRLPRDSSKTRYHNRCLISGRPHGIFRFFGLSRHFIREYTYQGFLPGVIKSSW
uniref:Small ribosomal subunit protein uS14c n=1 Tax=Derbesia sp. WEST4838 TaxID=1847751 RepID=A0A1C9JBF8_9CHLO|nr:ribosomal protein S14 [Derbesia sp. WEST4838]AOP19189.1 ribosomal protein S14 [Derbesia sp. WEST4838]